MDSHSLTIDPGAIGGPPQVAQAASMSLRAPIGNRTTNPSLEVNEDAWIDHTNGCNGVVRGRQTGWAWDGGYSMRHRGVSGAADIGGGLHGYTGSLILVDAVQPGFIVAPGQSWQMSVHCNVLAGPPVGDPGLWAELFWFDAGLAFIAQVNGPSVFQPTRLGVQTVSVAGTAPPLAAWLQTVIVMASNQTGILMDYYADAASVLRNS